MSERKWWEPIDKKECKTCEEERSCHDCDVKPKEAIREITEDYKRIKQEQKEFEKRELEECNEVE